MLISLTALQTTFKAGKSTRNKFYRKGSLHVGLSKSSQCLSFILSGQVANFNKFLTWDDLSYLAQGNYIEQKV